MTPQAVASATAVPEKIKIYCLDDSEAAFQSEDFLPNRWSFQFEAVSCISKAAVVPRRPGHGQPSPSSESYAVVCSGERPRLIIPPCLDRAQLYNLRQHSSHGDYGQLAQSLRLALLLSRRAKSSRAVLFCGSEVQLTEQDADQLATSISAAGMHLDLVVLGASDSSSSEAHALLEDMIHSVNRRFSEASTAAATTATTSNHNQQIARLVYVPAPDIGLSLWQQLEPLMEQLGVDAEDPDEADDDDLPPLRTPSTSTHAPSTSNRYPLLRPPSGSGVPGASSRLPMFPPSIKLGSRTLQPGICRYESLDSLQHLSTDGFLRSWLPSYANVSKVLPTTSTSAAGAKYCYISVYKLHVPKWHKLLTVSAGRMVVDYGDGVAAEEVTGPSGTATVAGSRRSSGGGEGGRPPLGRPPLPPGALGGLFPRSGSSGGEATAAHHGVAAAASLMDLHPAAVDAKQQQQQQHPVRLKSDVRKGTLSLLHSTDDQNTVKLVWLERSVAHDSKYTSIFAGEGGSDSAEDGSSDLGAAEVDITLSATRTVFKCAAGTNNQVLEVEYLGSTSTSGNNNSNSSSGSSRQRSHPRLFFWLQQQYQAEGATGASALAEQLQSLLEDPPEFDPQKHGGKARANGTPVQLGPLPISLVEEIMRASGKELMPDGSIANLGEQKKRPGTPSGLSSAPAAEGGRERARSVDDASGSRTRFSSSNKYMSGRNPLTQLLTSSASLPPPMPGSARPASLRSSVSADLPEVGVRESEGVERVGGGPSRGLVSHPLLHSPAKSSRDSLCSDEDSDFGSSLGSLNSACFTARSKSAAVAARRHPELNPHAPHPSLDMQEPHHGGGPDRHHADPAAKAAAATAAATIVAAGVAQGSTEAKNDDSLMFDLD